MRSSATPSRAATRRVSAISDSGIPNSLSVRGRYSPAPAARCAARRLERRRCNIGCSSRGGPGSTTTVGPPAAAPSAAAGRRDPAPSRPARARSRRAGRGLLAVAVPDRPRSRLGSARSAAHDPAICASSGPSSTISRSWKGRPPRWSRSSAVGPRPPLVSTRSMPCSAMNTSAARCLRAVPDDHRVGQVHTQLAQALCEPRTRCDR